ncbi:type II toxin-antitoxin system HicB family antitoxin [Trinickia diaoshuihuensis]|uniref:type II toxin-antitoxin system HicB family antitoxin n=1 Tax=Trinickia diaoshuihuensis TaxID=2292265 RepID=UPI000E284F3A|nr:type II toxin-antitoxin system HicB family antitoxin [Trinickia diaoshuihuensis]
MNLLTIGDLRAVVSYDPDTKLLRGEFIGLNGGAEFYAPDLVSLQAEGAKSLAAFLQTCRENDIAPGSSG